MLIHKHHLIAIAMGLFLGMASPAFSGAGAGPQTQDRTDQGRPAALTPDQIQALKADPRGPFQSIQWFCPDGSILPARQACPEPGGSQHGKLKDWVADLESRAGIHVNLVLAGSDPGALWDEANTQSRLKQYSLTQFLVQADQGWIYKKAQYYRGAIQAEEENTWGGKFLEDLLARDTELKTRFFQVREACRAIPHFSRNRDRLKAIRTLSKTLSDAIPDFTDLRIKIHGQPGPEDQEAVGAFFKGREGLAEEHAGLARELLSLLTEEYLRSPAQNLADLLDRNSLKIPGLAQATRHLAVLAGNGTFDRPEIFHAMADLMVLIRQQMPRARYRVSLMDASLGLESILFAAIRNWQPDTWAGLLDQAQVLVRAAAGAGYLELWELEAFDKSALPQAGEAAAFQALALRTEQIRRSVDWGVAMIRTYYQPEVALFQAFEPLANGFLDDRVRASVLLALGETAGRLSGQMSALSGQVRDLPQGMPPGSVKGINPGLAFGTLEVRADAAAPGETDPQNIYAFRRVPSELKPVAGILAQAEGNLVSHVQLLARNLGIPNAGLAASDIDKLAPLAGKPVFFAVSPKGGVILKADEKMTDQERDLVKKKEREKTLFRVPVEKIDLSVITPVRLSTLRAADSGKLCGPKAANLGQLKHLFPDQVGEGLVLPFGVFRRHMDQPMPGQGSSYWDYLTRAFAAKENDESGRLAALAELRAAMKDLPFLPGFEQDLDQAFQQAFGQGLGKVAVFIRSDTNMEDIKSFTGAGLNLTLFNVRDRDALLRGIRDVWASPYSERSYLWRQKYLSNPENVFPSILLLPTVPVDRSGVVITHGMVSDQPLDITVAFSRGPGGAVDGQTAETHLLTADGRDLLLSPARERTATFLPLTGGKAKISVHLDQPVLSARDIGEIRALVAQVRQQLPHTPGMEGEGPYDIELGFEKDRMRLFQVRPYVENKRAAATTYLLEMDRQQTGPKTLDLKQRILP